MASSKAPRCRLLSREAEHDSKNIRYWARYACHKGIARGKVEIQWRRWYDPAGECDIDYITTQPLDARRHGFAAQALYEELKKFNNVRCRVLMGQAIGEAYGFWDAVPGIEFEREDMPETLLRSRRGRVKLR